jgi:predicted metal-dependent phosphoesterase TrpH
MKLKFDLHVHTSNSKDAFTPTSELSRLCKLKGLDGIAVTDHNLPCTIISDGAITIPGTEISSSDGHVIGLGISHQLKRGLSADQTIMKIHAIGGLAIIPHPYDLFRSSVRPERLTVRPDAIEVFNASSKFHSIQWKKALTHARNAQLPMVAGSDSHIPQTLGAAYTIVESVASKPDAVLHAIGKGAVIPVPGTVKLSQRIRKLFLQATAHR